MNSRMAKYKNEDTIPTRIDKNKELYKQIYNAYDDFENLIVPPNSREINMKDLKKEITSRQEYHERKDYMDITDNNKVKRKEKIQEEQKQEQEIYDINELLNKAVIEKKEEEPESTLSNRDYLKKLKLDNYKNNLEQVKELYEEPQDELPEEDESLIKTANLSLEILSDLKSDNDSTMTSIPIKNEEIREDSTEMDFYSNNYKFSKKDFENSEEPEEEPEENEKTGKLFFKILFLVFGILVIGIILYFIINYFNQV